jgi:tol-pal system protein YbgF
MSIHRFPGRFSAPVLAAALAFAAFAQSANAALFDDDEARRRIESTNQRLTAVQRELEDRMGALEQQLKSQGLVDLFNQTEQMRADLAKLRGQIEVLTYELEQAQKRQRDLYVDLDTRMRKLETAAANPSAPPAAEGAAAAGAGGPGEPGGPGSAGGPGVGAGNAGGNASGASNPPGFGPPPPASGAAGARATPGIETLPGSAAPAGSSGTFAPAPGTPGATGASPRTVDAVAEQRAYDAALDQFKRGDYTAAIASFNAFTRTYPRSPLASSAQYWVGNAQYARRDYRGAIATQRALLQSYPDSSKAPDALLNIASAQADLNDNAAARRTLEELIGRYPQSEAATKARQRLGQR